jgi:hypothetical protein
MFLLLLANMARISSLDPARLAVADADNAFAPAPSYHVFRLVHALLASDRVAHLFPRIVT